jgi:hypothetical protein
MEQLQSYHDAKLTGVLLINVSTAQQSLSLGSPPIVVVRQNESLLHLLEGPAEILTSLFRHFNISTSGIAHKYDEVSPPLCIDHRVGERCLTGLHLQIRILMSSEDCPERRLPCWTHYILQVSRSEMAILVSSTV